MRLFLLLLALLVAVPAHAVRHAEFETLSAAGMRAEYHRLSGELGRHAERSVWSGAEAAYVALVALESAWPGDTPLTLKDHLAGAWAANARGDLLNVRERLLRAHAHTDSREVVEWLWAIDTSYSRVTLRGTELIIDKRPFDPVQQRALAHATEQLSETGQFEGLLPRARYILDDTPFEVRAGKATVLMLEASSRKRKKKKKRG